MDWSAEKDASPEVFSGLISDISYELRYSLEALGVF